MIIHQSQVPLRFRSPSLSKSFQIFHFDPEFHILHRLVIHRPSESTRARPDGKPKWACVGTFRISFFSGWVRCCEGRGLLNTSRVAAERHCGYEEEFDTPSSQPRLKIESLSVVVLSAKDSRSMPMARRMERCILDIRVSPVRQ